MVLRQATAADASALSEFNAAVHGREDNSDAGVREWTLELLDGTHPTVGPDDHLIVVDESSGAIASTLNLIQQTWSYGEVDIPVGQVELVGTHPDHRRRGLVRRQFEVAHRWCAQRGLAVQAIQGIPWYYRQFGYTYALDSWAGRSASINDVEEAGADPSVRLRAATLDDVASVARLVARGRDRNLLTCLRDEAFWRYQLVGRRPGSSERADHLILERADGTAVGVLVVASELIDTDARGHGMWALAFELDDGVGWVQPTRQVLAHLRRAGLERERAADGKTCTAVVLGLGQAHPAYDAAPQTLRPGTDAYGWYLRVPDLSAFLALVAPVLERRLAGSVACDHTGEVTINTYTGAVCLAFDAGRLTAVEGRDPTGWRDATASLPRDAFLQLLFGFRDLDQVRVAYPDARVHGDGNEALVRALFPRQPSAVWPAL